MHGLHVAQMAQTPRDRQRRTRRRYHRGTRAYQGTGTRGHVCCALHGRAA